MSLNRRWAFAALVATTALVSSAFAEPKPGMGSLGGTAGVPVLFGDSDLKDGQRPRLLGQMHFQYVISPEWRVSTRFGFGWVGYKGGTPTPLYKLDGDTPIVPDTYYPLYDRDTGDSVRVRDDLLTEFQPISVSLLRAIWPQGKGWSPYAGAGVNLTRVTMVNKRLKVKDPATFEPFVFWSPGVHVEGGAEYYLVEGKNVSLEWNGRFTQLLRRDTKKFPSGFSGRHSYLELNFGVNVYFWPVGHKPIEVAPAPEPEGGDTTPAPPDTDGTGGGGGGGDLAPRAARAAAVPAGAHGWHGSVLAKPKPAATPAAPDAKAAPAAADSAVDDAPACPAYDLGPLLGVPHGGARPEGRPLP